MSEAPERIWIYSNKDCVRYMQMSFSEKRLDSDIEYIRKDIADAEYNDALREGHNQGYQEGYCDAEKDIAQAIKEEEDERNGRGKGDKN